jgi:hypothetical protein
MCVDDRFLTDSELLRRHLEYSDASADGTSICLAKCQNDYICRQRNADYDKYVECVKLFSDNITLPTQPTAQTEDILTEDILTVSTMESTTMDSGGAILTSGNMSSMFCVLHFVIAYVTALHL